LKNGKVWLRFLGVGLLFLLIWWINPTKLIDVLEKANIIIIIIAVILTLPQIIIKSYRWQIMLRSQNIQYSLWNATLAYYGSLFIGLLTPGRFGEFIKASHVSLDCNVSSGKALSSVLADRLFDLYILILFGCITLVSFSDLNDIYMAGLVLFMVICLTVGFVLFISDSGFSWLNKLFVYAIRQGILKDTWLERFLGSESWLVKMRAGFRLLSATTLLICSLLTLLTYGIFFFQCYLLALALGMRVTFVTVMSAVSLGSLVTLLPVSISGLGTREASIVAYLGKVGVPAESALSFSLLVFITFYIVGGLLGAVAWWLKPVPLKSSLSSNSKS